jgi:anti-sigma factor RsiW
MMDAKKRDDRDLMRLHDGELAPEERAKVEARLDEADRERLSAMSDLGALLRHTLEAETQGFDVAAAVMRKIAERKEKSFSERIGGWFRGHRTVWIPGGLAAAAVALALLVTPWGAAISNGCDIESLEVTGAAATILKMPDAKGEGTTTVVWLDEEEIE